MGVFNVKHAGEIRFSAAVDSSETNSWEPGRVLQVNTSGKLVIYDGTNTVKQVGVAMEKRYLSTSVGPNVTVAKIGAPTGEVYSILSSDAVIVNDQLRSGLTFAPGDKVFVDDAGRLTTSGNGTGAYSPLMGFALGWANAGDSGRPLEYAQHIEY